MKDFSRLLCLFPVMAILAVTSVRDVVAQGPPRGPSESLDERKSELWKTLSDEEREKLKQALRSVWSDPAVVSARYEVQQASEAYHKAVKAAINKADPSAAKVLGKLHSLSGGPPGDRKGDRRGPGHPFSHRGERPIGESIGFPAAMGEFSDDDRTRFREVEAKARETSAVKAILADLAATREEDDAIRKSKLDLFRRFRKVMFAEMVKIDPQVEGLVTKLRSAIDSRESGKGGSGKKGAVRPGGKEGRKRPESE